MIARAIRIAKRLASVAVSANCHDGSPKRRCISCPTHSASSLGSISVIPRGACAAIARSVGSGAWPVIAPVSPRQKSTYSWPSTSVKRAPSASAANTGKPPGQRVIQCIGTPPSSVRLRLLGQRERARVLGAEALELAVHQSSTRVMAGDSAQEAARVAT